MSAHEHPEASPSPGSNSAGSHNVRRHTRNKKSDPFLELSNDVVNLTEQPIPRRPNGDDNNGDVDQGNSMLADLVLTPLNMVTFIISLILVDEQERRWRLSQRADSASFWHRFTHWSESHWEPYQDAGTSAWGHRSQPAVEPAGHHPTSSFSSWHYRRKKGAIARLEVGDALDMRGRVLVALIAWALLGTLALYYAMRHGYNWVAA
ncbi:hypothetical protein Q7P37_002977 [Cladosporium fusiforme]